MRATTCQVVDPLLSLWKRLTHIGKMPMPRYAFTPTNRPRPIGPTGS